MSVVGRAHRSLVYGRRVRRLAEHLTAILPPETSVLDVGAGDGLIDSLIRSRRPDLRIRGIDVVVRPEPFIEVERFDGLSIPYTDEQFDLVTFVDVLHHAADPMALLREGKRVAKRWIVIKDHTRNGFLAGPTLRLMDWVGNSDHDVALPYDYWPADRWRKAFEELGLEIELWISDLQLYPFPASLLFDRQLHFLSRLRKP